MGDVASWVGVVVGAFSLVVAIQALRKSDAAQRDAAAAQRRIVEIEEERESRVRQSSKKARLRAEMIANGGSEQLIVINDGDAEARDVHIFVNEVPLNEHADFVVRQVQRPIIGPRSRISFLIARHMQSDPLPYRLSIEWKDDSGESGGYRSAIG